MTDDTPRLAVLIDADNTSPKQTKEMFEELASYGTLTVKRAYGDWTTQQLAGWKDQLLGSAISPMQQFANTKGKNSTDSALIIDAMDLLYAGNVDGFVIVSSDADFTRLATRLRESGMTVYGLGQRKTPAAFVEACDKFIFLEVLRSGGAGGDDRGVPETREPAREPDGDLHSLITRSVKKSPQDDDDWVQLGTLGNLLNRTDPSFDPRTWGSAKLGDLVRSLPYLETRSVKGASGRAELWVRLKGRTPAEEPATPEGRTSRRAPRTSRREAAAQSDAQSEAQSDAQSDARPETQSPPESPAEVPETSPGKAPAKSPETSPAGSPEEAPEAVEAPPAKKAPAKRTRAKKAAAAPEPAKQTDQSDQSSSEGTNAVVEAVEALVDAPVEAPAAPRKRATRTRKKAAATPPEPEAAPQPAAEPAPTSKVTTSAPKVKRRATRVQGAPDQSPDPS